MLQTSWYAKYEAEEEKENSSHFRVLLKPTLIYERGKT
jgi:hypothetical protein